jgi:nitrous oxide reductase accessory protein NosL
MNAARLLFLSFLILLSFSGCEKKEISTELHEVHWDRDMCARCKMVTSDRHHAAQVINPENGRSYMFDDIGCVLLWFDDEKITWKDKAKIWITDVDTGKWIDARTAFYDTHNITPMAYGFAAHTTKESIKAGEEIVHFNKLFERVSKIEEENNNRRAY